MTNDEDDVSIISRLRFLTDMYLVTKPNRSTIHNRCYKQQHPIVQANSTNPGTIPNAPTPGAYPYHTLHIHIIRLFLELPLEPTQTEDSIATSPGLSKQ